MGRYKLKPTDIHQLSIIKNNMLFIDDIDKLQELDNTIVNKLLENLKVPVICTCRFIPKRLAKKKEGVHKIELKYMNQKQIKSWLKENKYPQKFAYIFNGDLNAFITRIEMWKLTSWVAHDHLYYKHIDDRMRELPTTSLHDAFADHIEEPGAMAGLIQENTPYFKNITLDKLAKISDNLSFADVYTSPLYDGLFMASPIYQDLFYASTIVNVRGCQVPTTIKPGQAWTKHINMIARQNKLLKFKNKNPSTITTDHIVIFNHLLTTVKKIDVKQLQGYIIENEDVDIFTKLFTISKITTRVKTQLKEILKELQK